MMQFEACWMVDPERRRGAGFAPVGDPADSDAGYSFHGPHVATGSMTLSNGVSLVLSDQSGVLLSENPDSPRHNATCFDRGTTIKSADGKALGDVMLLEDTDAAGDVTWLYHEWWYGQGPGRYRFLMGTGRWKGIEGEGRTAGMVARRADDHYMPKWELSWRIQG